MLETTRLGNERTHDWPIRKHYWLSLTAECRVPSVSSLSCTLVVVEVRFAVSALLVRNLLPCVTKENNTWPLHDNAWCTHAIRSLLLVSIIANAMILLGILWNDVFILELSIACVGRICFGMHHLLKSKKS